jgi:adenylosuccinate lyase
LRPEPVATQVVGRDKHAAFLAALALLGCGLERLGIEIRHLQRTEVGEAEEPFGAGRRAARRCRTSATRSAPNAWWEWRGCCAATPRPLRERRALARARYLAQLGRTRHPADACAIADTMLDSAAKLVAGLVVYPDRMRANLELTHGLVFSGALLLELVQTGMERDAAYRLVQTASRTASESGRSLLQVSLETPAISNPLGREHLEQLFDLRHALRHVEAIFGRVLESEG